MVFAVLKRCLWEERDDWLQINQGKINKTNFLEIYQKAHLRALKPETIKATFAKTGVWPFNPDATPKEAFAPSKETSSEGHLPLIPPTPVRVIAKLLKDIELDVIDEEGESDSSEVPESSRGTGHTALCTSFQDAAQKLSKTSLGYLLHNQPIKSVQPIPSMPPFQISPSSPHGALTIVPETLNETLLLAALREAEHQKSVLEERVIALQAANILNETYCNKL